MAKITLNELKSIIKQIIMEDNELKYMRHRNPSTERGSAWAKNGFNDSDRTLPQEWENVEWSVNGHSVSFKGKMYFQKNTGFMFIEKEDGEVYKPQSSIKLFWRKISDV